MWTPFLGGGAGMGLTYTAVLYYCILFHNAQQCRGYLIAAEKKGENDRGSHAPATPNWAPAYYEKGGLGFPRPPTTNIYCRENVPIT